MYPICYGIGHRIRVVGGDVAIATSLAVLTAAHVEKAEAEGRPRIFRRSSSTAIAKLLLVERLELRDLPERVCADDAETTKKIHQSKESG